MNYSVTAGTDEAQQSWVPLNLVAEIENSSVSSDQGIRFGKDSSNTNDVTIYPLVNDFRMRGMGWCRCDADGNIYQQVTEAGDTLSKLFISCTGVQLR